MTSACKSLGENRCHFLIEILRYFLCISRVQTIYFMIVTQTLLRYTDGNCGKSEEHRIRALEKWFGIVLNEAGKKGMAGFAMDLTTHAH